jgi:hypothetical protein
MTRFFYIPLIAFVLFLPVACSPIHYGDLAENPDASIVYVKEEVSGELSTWNKIGASFGRIDGTAPGLLSRHDIVYLLPGRHQLEIMAFALLEYDQ